MAEIWEGKWVKDADSKVFVFWALVSISRLDLVVKHLPKMGPPSNIIASLATKDCKIFLSTHSTHILHLHACTVILSVGNWLFHILFQFYVQNMGTKH